MSKNPRNDKDLAQRGSGAQSGGANQGEGDKASARRFNEAQQEFVQSEEGQAAIEQAGEVRPDERGDLDAAERAGRERAKAEDPAVTRAYRGSKS